MADTPIEVLDPTVEEDVPCPRRHAPPLITRTYFADCMRERERAVMQWLKLANCRQQLVDTPARAFRPRRYMRGRLRKGLSRSSWSSSMSAFRMGTKRRLLRE